MLVEPKYGMTHNQILQSSTRWCPVSPSAAACREDARLARASISIKIPEAAKKQQAAREEQHLVLLGGGVQIKNGSLHPG